MKRLFKQKIARTSITAGLEGSTHLPGSGFAFMNNSQGASASIIELSRVLDDVLDEVEFDGESSDFAKLELQRLDDVVSKYANSRFIANESHPDWLCKPEDAPLLLASAKCSNAAYQSIDTRIIADDTYRYELLEYVEPSRLGTVKATAFYQARELRPINRTSRDLLVIAVRGSASRVDHMVNINNQATAIGDFIPNSPLPNVNIDGHPPQVHSGFLIGAKSLLEHVKRQLEKCETDTGAKDVVFTGHSAGASVASLLFQHFLALTPTKYPSLMLSCVTFGSPPVCNASFSALASQARLEATSWRVHVNFLNEFDIVPRLDKLYVLSLINLYRNRFLLPPIITDNTSHDPGFLGHTSSLKSDLASSWPLPDPVFVHLGDTVLLSLVEVSDNEEFTNRLKASHIDSKTLGSLLFCRITAHKMTIYLANMEELFS